jgi:hypothetical protein
MSNAPSRFRLILPIAQRTKINTSEQRSTPAYRQSP